MNSFDYLFAFDDIVDGYSNVNFINNLQSKSFSFDVSVDDENVRLLNGSCLSPLQADLLDLATAIHFADKLAIPRKSKAIQVQVTLPLRHPEIFANNSSLLQDLLFWYTRDYWHFQFFVRESQVRNSEQRLVGQLNLTYSPESSEFALWSGGLDSFAGLRTRLLDASSKNFTLIGTGSNNIMHKTQQQVFQTLRYLPHASGRLRFLQIPIRANYGARYSHNRSHRARGIVFLLIGAVSALSAGQNKLHVYENGIGAINLPLPGGVGRDHTKAVHPISLIKVGNFISSVIGEEFLISNPFIFSTKAEMCSSLKLSSHLIFETISCDRLHREKYIQCGFCSSCVLRRQALASAGIKDPTRYLIPHGKKPQERHMSYWRLMNQQVNTINKALSSSEPLFHLQMAFSSDLPDIVGHIADQDRLKRDVIEEKIVELYRTYVNEWLSSADSILDDMKGGKSHEYYLEDEKWQQMKLLS